MDDNTDWKILQNTKRSKADGDLTDGGGQLAKEYRVPEKMGEGGGAGITSEKWRAGW